MRYREGLSCLQLLLFGVVSEPFLISPLSGFACRWDGEVHTWQMADDSRWGSIEDDKTGWPGLDLPVQLAAEARLPEEIQLQWFQQESTSEGAVESVYL